MTVTFQGDGHLTGLYYLRARYYDPATSRFLTRDPFPGFAFDPSSQQPYVYARNNPALYTDPSGEFAFIPLLLVAAAGGFLGGVSYYTLEAYLQADPCTGMQWKWQEALFWGGVGTGIGAVIGTGIYGGWWVGVQLGWWGPTAAGGGLAAQQVAQRASVWSQAPLQRGVAIENTLGRSSFLAQNFPTIDRFVNGIATSIKSIDLSATSYQDMGTLTRTVKGYIDTMAVYQGQLTLWGSVKILPYEITGRTIDLTIPAGAGTEVQLAVLQALQQYAATVGVTLNIIPVP